ncbi:MAG: archease [Thermoanaerobaculia bacterium]
MTYRFIEHTADTGLEVEARTLDELFVEALRGMTDCITEVEQVVPKTRRRLVVQAGDLGRLLVEWLSEVVYLFEVEDLLLSQAEVEIKESKEGFDLEATAAGEPYDPDRHPVKIALKAVTYHQLKVEQTPDGWQARVIFDI